MRCIHCDLDSGGPETRNPFGSHPRSSLCIGALRAEVARLKPFEDAINGASIGKLTEIIDYHIKPMSDGKSAATEIVSILRTQASDGEEKGKE